MKIDKTFKIKEKYFNAILDNNFNNHKFFELRHEEIPENSIIKLECENGKNVIFKSGKCFLIDNKINYYLNNSTYENDELTHAYKDESISISNETYYIHFSKITKLYKCSKNIEISYNGSLTLLDMEQESFNINWFDEFCWEYITKAPTYLIEIAEILEAK